MPGCFFELVLESPGWDAWTPGQFVMIRPSDWGFEPLWARPFSIAWADDRELRLFFQVVGRGTARLARLKPGDTVTAWGPLGNGFAVEQGPTLLLAGGVGLAPFLGYIRRHPVPTDLELHFSHRLPRQCYPYDGLSRSLRCAAIRENTPQDLPGIIREIEGKVTEYADEGLILACGPTPFLRTVRQAALDAGARAQLSLENRMACGVGACLGCVADKPNGTRVQTCTAGPVFWAGDIEV